MPLFVNLPQPRRYLARVPVHTFRSSLGGRDLLYCTSTLALVFFQSRLLGKV